ncbi:exopolysaccharide biosynthesis protein [Hoeflea sp. CAU 1731]
MTDLLGALHERSGSSRRVSIAAIVGYLGTDSLSAVMLVPALVVVTPLSGVPGLSSVCGILIALVAAQRVMGKSHLWLPRWMLSRRIEREKLVNTIAWLEKPAYWIDKLTRRRLSLLVHKPFSTLMTLTCVLCGLAMPMLELVPFSSSILGSAVSLVAIALVARDGLVGFLALMIMAGLAAVTSSVL